MRWFFRRETSLGALGRRDLPPISHPLLWGAITVLIGFGLPATAQVATPDRAGQPPSNNATFLVLRDGTEHPGQPVGMASDQILHWQPPANQPPMEFAIARVASIMLQPIAKDDSVPPREPLMTRITLTNNNSFPARLQSINARQVRVDTRFAGALTIPRTTVAAIALANDNTSASYEGPTPANHTQWNLTLPKGAWTFHNNAFVCDATGFIGWDAHLAEACRIEFDYEWQEYIHLSAVVFTRADAPVASPACYWIQLTNNSLHLRWGRPNWDEGEIDAIAKVNLFPVGNQLTRLTIIADRQQGRLTLLANNQPVGHWSNLAAQSLTGTGIAFMADGGRHTRIRNLHVSPRLPIDATNTTNNHNSDQVIFHNGDHIAAQVTAVSTNEITFESSGATLSRPLERVAVIQFAPAPNASTNVNTQTIENCVALLSDGGTITFSLESITPTEIVGRSTALGRVHLARAQISGLRFLQATPSAPTVAP